MKEVRPNIAFAGLTAAGKTTHAKILAQELGYEYVSATAIMLDIMDIENTKEVWFTDYEQIEKAREGDVVDIELERRVREMSDTNDGLVLDTWAMAHIYDGPLIRIWMESDEPSRARKCYVSQGENKMRDLDGCLELITQKDGDTREKFLDRLDFDLFTDMTRYDAVICNTDLIPEPTDIASAEGIRSFRPVVHNVVSYLIDQALGAESNAQSPTSLSSKYGSMVRRVNETPWSF